MRSNIRHLQAANVNSRVGGSTLIEVLIALLLLAIGVLGAASMQLNSLKYNQLAMTRSQAMAAAYSILDSMRVNVGQSFIQNVGTSSSVVSQYITADSANWAANSTAGIDLNAWKNALSLFGATGQITSLTVNGLQQVTVTINWDQSRGPVVKGVSNASTGSVQVVTLM